MSGHVTTLDVATDYTSSGISIIPVRLDGSKAPAIRSWKEYQSRIATADELREWFRRPAGFGVVCGAISGSVEVLDFDEDADETFHAWWTKLSPATRGKLTVCETGGLGYHVPYRCESICGAEKIAKRSDGEVLIESRGEGSYVVGCGSPLEVHASRNPYVQVRGAALPSLPTLTADERKHLWQSASEFDQRNRDAVVLEYVRKLAPRIAVEVDQSTPWGDFDVRGSWSDILEPHGWITRDGIHWTRPGKKHGVSASVVTAKNGCEVLTVFSGNAGELSPSVGSHRTLGKFEAFKLLYHAGNASEAAKAIHSIGYGEKPNEVRHKYTAPPSG